MRRKLIVTAIFIFSGLIHSLPGKAANLTGADTIRNKEFEADSDIKENPRKLRPLGVSLGGATTLVGDPAFIMLRINYFIIPQLETEVNIGYKYSSAGGKFHLNRKNSERRITPYAGVLGGIERGTGILQIPVGVEYITGNGFSLAFSINEFIYLEYKRSEWLFDLSAGWNFRLRRQKI